MSQEKNIKVTVISLVYNQEQYIEKCLDGLLNQKTDFEYEVVVHDDCSSDHTLDILKKYKKAYPDRLIVVEESENQFSKHNDRFPNQFLAPYIKGKYIALCEGDDYWISYDKLQKQYEYMELHSECSMCTHNTRKYSIEKNKFIGNFFDWDEIHRLTDEEIIVDWTVHLTSFFMRREAYDWELVLPSIWAGDYGFLTYARALGFIDALPDVMSVYRCENPAGALKNRLSKPGDIVASLVGEKERIEYLLKYDELTKNKFCRFVNQKIGELHRRCLYYEKKLRMIAIMDDENFGELIKKYIKRNAYSNIAIYGCGNVGKKIGDEVACKEISCYIEKEKDGVYNGLPIKPLSTLKEKDFNSIDAIIITPVNVFKEICDSLRKKGYTGNLLSIEDVILNL